MSTPVTAVPAATIVLLRDGADGLEVLVMERHKTMGFAAGAVVFPGGKVDASDSAPELLEHFVERDEQDLPLLPYRIAGIRELFEEAGVLLAESSAGDEFALSRRRELIERYREGLLANEMGLLDMALGDGLRFQPSVLHHFAHWVTPEPVPKRFDTQFFVAIAPSDQWELVEGNESVAMDWRRPNGLLSDEAAGKIGLMFPTRLNLQVLSRHESAVDVIAEASKRPVVTVMPKVVMEGDEVFLEIPEEAGYGITRVPRRDVLEARSMMPHS